MTTLASHRPQRTPFQSFLVEHRAPVLAYLRGMLGAVDADDCFQETFVAALRAYESLDPDNPRAWVMTIARNKAIDHHRASARRPIPRGDELPEVAAPAPAGHDPELWGRVAALPPKQREAVALRFAGDMCYREIGIAMDSTEAAARRNVHEGLKNLREDLSRSTGEEAA